MTSLAGCAPATAEQVPERCPACGRGLHRRAPPRRRECSECRKPFVQSGPGRPRLTCSPRCRQRRHNRLRGRGWQIPMFEGTAICRAAGGSR